MTEFFSRQTDKLLFRIVVALIIVGAISMMGIVAYSQFTLARAEKDCAPIVSIGGCDSLGQCGVTLQNGAASKHRHPALGEIICVPRKKS